MTWNREKEKEVVFYSKGHTEFWFFARDYKINGQDYRKASTDELLDELLKVKGTVKEQLIKKQLDKKYRY